MLAYLLGTLCGLGAATFATAANRDRRVVAALPIGFAVAVAGLLAGWRPGAATIGATAFAIVLLHFVRPALRAVTVAAGGALAVGWGAYLSSQGVPAPAAWSLAVALPLSAILLRLREPSFAPRRLREEAMLMVCALGLVVAVSSEIVAGWRTASVLNLAQDGRVGGAVNTWILVLVGASVLLGGWHSMARRR